MTDGQSASLSWYHSHLGPVTTQILLSVAVLMWGALSHESVRLYFATAARSRQQSYSGGRVLENPMTLFTVSNLG
jgi:hypothetical protein